MRESEVLPALNLWRGVASIERYYYVVLKNWIKQSWSSKRGWSLQTDGLLIRGVLQLWLKCGNC